MKAIRLPETCLIDLITGSWFQNGACSATIGAEFGNYLGNVREKEKQPNDVIVAAFRKRLREVAGFGYVPDPIPMRNSKKAIVYYLFLASPKAVAEKIITAIFNKYR